MKLNSFSFLQGKKLLIQGFVRLILNGIRDALKESPNNEKLKDLEDILQSMLEDE